jgi:hypothetical protein
VDVKQYFRKIRDLEATLKEEYPIVISRETSDGGKPGLIIEVSRENAARLIVEGRAVLATEDERRQYLEQQAAVRRAAEKAELAKYVQVAILNESEIPPQMPSKRK